jgi:hypothetical protein
VTVTRKRIALWLWIAWAVVVWNVVFDRVIVVAGREYLNEARAAAKAGSYAKIDDTMRPARSRALWLATGSAAGILAIGIISITRLRRT